jgi:DNA-binding beta-propeller fold protein YncE
VFVNYNVPISTPHDLVISSTESRIYVAFGRTRNAAIAVIDRQSNAVIAVSRAGTTQLNSAKCLVPGNLAMHPDGERLYLLSGMGLHVFDINNLAIKKVAESCIDLSAHCVAVHPDGGHVYIIHPDGSIVAAIDAFTDKIANVY